MKKDITSKEAILAITEDIAALLLGLDISDVELVDKELRRVEKREADIVAKCKINAKQQILHLEIQNNNDKTMAQRMLRYHSELQIKFPGLEINQYVIYIGKQRLSMPDYIKMAKLNYEYTIINMHKIDCDKFIKMDTPEALVLSVLCDFKGKKETEVLFYIANRLQQLSKNNDHQLGKYMLMLETLSDNRDLKEKLKEVESMLSEINYERLPSYEIGMEKGMEKGMAKGMDKGREEGLWDAAIMMLNDFNLEPKQVAEKLNLNLDELLDRLKQRN